MKTRNHDWFNTETGTSMYGFQVFDTNQQVWCHAHEDGKPCIYATKTERDSKRAEARKKKI